MFSDTNTVMYLSMIFLVLCLGGIIILKLLNNAVNPLRKSWNIYIAMITINAIFFMGLFVCLPSTNPALPIDYDKEAIEKIENLQDTKSILIQQQREINELKDSANTFKNILWVFFSMWSVFFPIIYYNLIKSNLDIEKLSGKRMGSFD